MLQKTWFNASTVFLIISNHPLHNISLYPLNIHLQKQQLFIYINGHVFISVVLVTVGVTREIREEWPPLTVETIRQRVTQGVHLKGVLAWLVRWSRHAGTRYFYLALADLVGPVHIIFFLTLHNFMSFVPIAQQARKAVVPGLQSLNMCLWE